MADVGKRVFRDNDEDVGLARWLETLKESVSLAFENRHCDLCQTINIFLSSSATSY